VQRGAEDRHADVKAGRRGVDIGSVSMRRPHCFVIAVLVAGPLLSAAFAVVSTPAAAMERTPEIRSLDHRIRNADRHLRTWTRRLDRWQRRVAHAAVSVQRLTERVEARPSSVLEPVLLSRHNLRSSLLPFHLEQAHRNLRQVLHDAEARNAQQQLAAWGAYQADLQRARRDLVRSLHHASTPDGGVPPGQPVTYGAWAGAFLARIGAPACDENVTLVITWETAESTEAVFNPLATTHAMDGATEFNTAGVKNYASLQQGLDASRDTLEQGTGSYGYGAILDALRACATAETTAAAINASAWCRGCAGGTYITGLLPIVRADVRGHASRLISVG
jgi:hypothetical protein